MQLQEEVGICKVGKIVSNTIGASEPTTETTTTVYMSKDAHEKMTLTITKFLMVAKDKASILSENQSHDPIHDCPPEQPCECLNSKEELVNGNGRKNPALMTMPGLLASLCSFNQY